MPERFKRISSFKKTADLRAHAGQLGLELRCDDRIWPAPDSPLAQSYAVGDFSVGNRFAIQPMEGWDGTETGLPTDWVRRRWRNFGLSGAKLIWGGEACAVCPEGRANPNQLLAIPETRGGLAELLQVLTDAHGEEFDRTDNLMIGLQLTHSGRFCRPFRKDRMEPAILYHHPILDRKFDIPADHPVLDDDHIRRLIERYIEAARIADEVGYHFVDVKHCHGYLGHEFLSARDRAGEFGGSFENRTRFCREILQGIRAVAPRLRLGVRVSAFDTVPFRPDPESSSEGRLGPGVPEGLHGLLPYRFGFGLAPEDPLRIDLTETLRFINALKEWGVELVNVSAGSPYYTPHIQRPALFPPSDGYQPPEDPLVGVVRQLRVTAEIKRNFPELAVIGSGYTYLQEYLPHVGQAEVRAGNVDFVGLGRMALSYFDLPADVLRSGGLQRKRICRTFSDCTTAPRNGLISGCYPLDPFYKNHPQAAALKNIKQLDQ
jgi:2,4-dienoyl-CoA reductase-like NADH-dependent reductase (Old Yellow Enzyme family)